MSRSARVSSGTVPRPPSQSLRMTAPTTMRAWSYHTSSPAPPPPGFATMKPASLIGVGGGAHVGERVPVGAPGVEGIEDEVAALGTVVARDIAPIDVVHEGVLAALLHPVQHPEDGRRLAGAGRAGEQEVARLLRSAARARPRW